MISASATHPGMVRQNNEDCVRADDALGVYLLADGIGGHNAGEVASALAVDTVYHVLRSNLPHTDTDGYPDLLMHAMHAAHWEISSKAQSDPALLRMGTTLVVVLVRGEKAYVVSAGDSRCYLFRPASLQPVGQMLQRLTNDHTLGDQMLEQGVSVDDIPKRQFHTLTRSIGCGNSPFPDYASVGIDRGDRLLVCSDGLTDMLGDAEIEEILAGKGSNLRELTDKLVAAANANGGRDNISVILIEYPVS